VKLLRIAFWVVVIGLLTAGLILILLGAEGIATELR
jgi:hypothetical protein